MSKFFSYTFKLFFEYKLSFRSLYKCDIVLLDDNHSKLEFKNKILFKIKRREIFFYYFIKSIILYLFQKKYDLKFYYYNLLYKKLDPKVAIGHSENENIINFKKFYPKAKTITYQIFGWNRSTWLYKEKISRLKKIYDHSDFFLVYSNQQKLLLKNIGIKNEKKIFVVGSVKSNEKKMKKKFIEYDILFISQFRKKGTLWDYIKNGRIYKNEKFINAFKKNQKFIVKTIQSYCKKYNKRFQIALVASREDKNFSKNYEIKYYKQILGKFLPDERNGWSLSETSALIVVQSSNIGTELEAAGHKVLFLPLDLRDLDLNRMIDSHNLPDSKAINICRQPNKKKIFKKINFLLNPKLSTYNRKNKIHFDKGNKILKKLITNITR